MAKDFPDSMDELVYFTRRKFPNGGSAVCWARRIECPKCKKALMSKPLDDKTGRFKTRAAEYTCNECGHSEEKKEHEEKLTAEITYTCPFCKHQGEIDTPYKRKSFYGKPAIVFPCGKCSEKLGITKKMSMPAKFAEKLGTQAEPDVEE